MSLDLKQGSILEGKVAKIKPFGALVQLPGNVFGLVHISNISSSFVQNVDDFVCVGDTVRVKVLSADEKSNKISLSIKDAIGENPNQGEGSPNPDDEEAPRYSSPPSVVSSGTNSSFEEKFKEYVKSSNERLASINKRNKKR
ncbi:MAG: S1 RNA-binding domain-containing protein [Clostridiales bacterium]|nr:S1 RNA-binding domain-containing protein [Clostridiales bacterium]